MLKVWKCCNRMGINHIIYWDIRLCYLFNKYVFTWMSPSAQDGDQLATAQLPRCQTSCSLLRCQSCPDQTARKIILVSTESTREWFALALMREVFLPAPVTVADPLLALMRTEPCNCLALSPGEWSHVARQTGQVSSQVLGSSGIGLMNTWLSKMRNKPRLWQCQGLIVFYVSKWNDPVWIGTRQDHDDEDNI